jgi:hypothetical protein
VKKISHAKARSRKALPRPSEDLLHNFERLPENFDKETKRYAHFPAFR